MRLMHSFYHAIERIWWSKKTPPLLLRLFEPVYKSISKWEQNKRLKNKVHPPLPLISIGNITVGGSGKTPFVLWLVNALQEQGWKPVILCRGDGGKSPSPVLLHADSLSQDVGDEALLLFQANLCPVIAGKDRVAASHMAKDLGNIMVLDDGFQYRQLERNLDIVLIPAEGIGNGYMLPAGPLRESKDGLKRADMVVRTGSFASVNITQQKEWHWMPVPLPLRNWASSTSSNHTPPTQMIAVTAIARPERFIQSLKESGIEVVHSYTFPDHYTFSKKDIQMFLKLKQPIVITAKDAVKIRELWPSHQPLWVLEQDFKAEDGLIETILNALPVGKPDQQC